MNKRILLLVSSMHAGGAERVAANLVNAWADQGHHVTLLVTYSERGSCVYCLDNRVQLIFLADKVRSFRRSGWSYLSRFLALRRFIRERRPDVVVSFLTNVNIATLMATIGTRIPTIVCERTYPPLLPVGSFLGRLRCWTYPLAKCVVMQSGKGLSWLEQEIPRARGAVIPNSIVYPLPVNDSQPIFDSFFAQDRMMLLAVGRMTEEKGFHWLIQAISSIFEMHPRWDLVILGDGPLRSTLAAQVLSLGLASRVIMPGTVGNMADWYKRADLYVLSSRVEGFPNTLGEAMAHGCAVVSFDCDTGPRDLIRHEVDGLLVAPGDVQALSQALCRLMQDDVLRYQMASLATGIRERYSMFRVLALWNQLFQDVAY